MIDLLIRNISELLTIPPNPGPAQEAESSLGIILDGTVAVDAGRILWIGRDADLPAEHLDARKTIDARGRLAMPGLIDSHTHLVFAGTRELEFEQRIAGRSYSEIAASGGGILSTVESVRAASLEELVDLARPRMDRFLSFGVTTLESKSGYGLTTVDEIKMLEAMAKLGEEALIDLVPTFLGAHEIPSEYKNNRDDYIKTLKEIMIPEISRRGLARFCDIFVEKGVYSINEAEEILGVAQAHGLGIKVHADQLSPLGGAELAARMGAVSADHLECISDAGIEALLDSGTVATLLPGCSFFLDLPYPSARRLLDAGLTVALSTDFNPGSCMTESLQLILSIACTQMRMLPFEAIRAVTINAARALGLEDSRGSLSPGLRADIVLMDVPNHRRLPYHFGISHTWKVFSEGDLKYETD